MKNESTTETYQKAETYQKNFANFCNVVSQNLTTMTAKFDKNFRNFLWGVASVSGQTVVIFASNFCIYIIIILIIMR